MELRYAYIPEGKTRKKTKTYDDHYIVYGTKKADILLELYKDAGDIKEGGFEAFKGQTVFDIDAFHLSGGKNTVDRKVLLLRVEELLNIWDSSTPPEGIPAIIFYAVKANSREKKLSGSIFLDTSISANDRKKLFI